MTEQGQQERPVPNNPAGRVLTFLREVQRRAKGRPNDGIGSSAAEALGVKYATTPYYRNLLELRLEAESVPTELAPFSDTPGHKAIFQHYTEITGAIARIQTNPSTQNSVVLTLSTGAWASIEYADDVLRRASSESHVTDAQVRDHLGSVQGLIRDVLADDTLTPSDKSEILRLLRNVEDALINVNIRGTRPVEEASLAVVGSMAVKKDLWDRMASKNWVKRLGHVVVGLLMLLDSAGGLPALGVDLGPDTHPRAEIVIVQQGGHQVLGSDEHDVIDAEVVDDGEANERSTR